MKRDNTPKRRSKQTFTIIKDDATDGHGGYGAGSISLENMSSIIVDPEGNQAYLEMDAMHARSDVERRVRYYNDKSKVPDGRLYWIAWVTVDVGENGLYYDGVTASELLIDKPNKRAYKSMPEHVKHMEQSLAGKIVVDHMDEHSRQLLGEYLKNYDDGKLWNNSRDEIKEAFQM
ncbi:MAG TPA: YwhD family protein [Bacillota bacterium]|nr:YwhD family protein [Bacillota bacterium]